MQGNIFFLHLLCSFRKRCDFALTNLKSQASTLKNMELKIATLPGDGVSPQIMQQGVAVAKNMLFFC